MDFHWEVIIGQAVQGIFSILIIVLLRKLHVMVNSEQTQVNRVSEAAQTRAGIAEGKLEEAQRRQDELDKSG